MVVIPQFMFWLIGLAKFGTNAQKFMKSLLLTADEGLKNHEKVWVLSFLFFWWLILGLSIDFKASLKTSKMQSQLRTSSRYVISNPVRSSRKKNLVGTCNKKINLLSDK